MTSSQCVWGAVAWCFAWLLLEPSVERIAYHTQKRRGKALPAHPSLTLGWWPSWSLVVGLIIIFLVCVLT